MKILISVDLEGVAGVCHPRQTRPGNPEYERARRWMTDEANAAIDGAFDAGATEVHVADGHGEGASLLADVLDARAQLIQGHPRLLGMAAGLDQGVDGICMVGYHARAQTAGILAHTIDSTAFAVVSFHGQVLGEAGIYGALAGEHGVPVLMASGDDVFIAENRPLFPDAVFVQTKRATGHTSGVSLSPAVACQRIRCGIVQALANRAKACTLVLQTPLVVSLQTHTLAQADLLALWPGFERVTPVELRFDAPTMAAAVRMLNGCSAMSAVLR